MNKLSLATTAALTIRAEASTQLAMPGGSLIRASSFTPEVSVSVFLPFPPAGGKPWVGWGGTMAHRLGAHQPPASGLGWCGNPYSVSLLCPTDSVLARLQSPSQTCRLCTETHNCTYKSRSFFNYIQLLKQV